MGNLTNDMTRLRGEVDALRSDRVALMRELAHGAKDLASSVSAMQADFAAAHATMAKQARGDREVFVASVIDEVNSLLGEFSKDRNDMAREGRHDRGVFLADMKRQVTGICKETADDLMGARLVWRGRSPGESRPVPMKKEPVVVKPISPPVEAAPKQGVTVPEFKAEKPSVTLGEPRKNEKKTVAVPEASAVETPKVKAPLAVGTSMPLFQKSKEKKNRLYEKTAKASSKSKYGRK